ncbi:MAG: lipid-A-disaccharide synthase [Planctomycetota bacterium]|nr:lipid-A-disaccharide synthase [Planctomycetota bacterium]
MKIFFSVGEPSGDLHGSNLIRELQNRDSTIECVGFGGPLMRTEGCQLLYDLTQFAVMWFVKVIMNLHRFVGFLRQAERYFSENQIDAVVLIDYPGFNWVIAKKAKRHGIPVFYYGVPQLWAWAPWRIRKMRKRVDYALCKLPFEEKWYRDRGCEARFVGHPFFDELKNQQLNQDFIEQMRSAEGKLITLLPGSRQQEVESQLPWFLKSVTRVREQVPETRFVIASFNQTQADYAQRLLDESGMDLDVYVGKTPELMLAAHGCLACSGSVSLELMYHHTPTVILYHVNRLKYLFAKMLIRSRYITLVNLIASKDPFLKRNELWHPIMEGAEDIPMPEYPTCTDKTVDVSRHLIQWLTDPTVYTQKVNRLKNLTDQFGTDGASGRAADFILNSITEPAADDVSQAA